MENTRPMTGDSIHARAISAFPISIATSLAMESLFKPQLTPYDPDRQIPNIVDVTKYSEIWINAQTLFRNMVGAMNKEALMQTSETEFRDAILQEMEVINSLFQIEGQGLCKPRYYYCDYKHLYTKTDKAIRFREDKTEGQKFLRYKLDVTMELLNKYTEDLRKFDSEVLPSSRSTSMILTHIPYDLLSSKRFTKLDLLESNTGRLKPRNMWYSKYYPIGDADMSIFPFTRKLLLVFGDKAQIQPSDMKLRKLIHEIAVKRKWTPATTSEKIKFDFELDIKEPYILEFLFKL